ncbi:MAG: 4-hydroxy-tetrahydrodipicolinate reductase [Methanomassiliicoccales archaeon]|nr:4-hydroxy-tetrahydrodipicolinate reductase [Methanomassiliicoccales archaeon]
MIDVAVAGATGKLGSMVCSLIREQEDMRLVGAVVSAEGGKIDQELYPGVKAVGPDGLEELCHRCTVLVDVTNAMAAERNLPLAVNAGANVVVGTTGFSPEFLDRFRSTLQQSGRSALMTPNFSIGVNVFWKACQTLARALPDYQVEIIEMHHDKKKDAPSGTAVKAAQLISAETGVSRMVYGREGLVGARGREIGIHAIRAGDIVGEHTVIFAGNRERIELTHRAHSRMAFAEGCVAAVRWVAPLKDGKVHGMEEVLGL